VRLYLQALRAVVETGTVTGAATRLHCTQPQASRLIASLEQELGFKVFSRHKRRLAMTQEGRVFYREIERVLTDFDGISNVIRDLRRTDEPRLRIVSQSFLVQTLVPAALTAFVRREPRLRYTLDVGSRADVQRWLTASTSTWPGGAAGRARTGDPQPALRHSAGGCGAAGGHRLARKGCSTRVTWRTSRSLRSGPTPCCAGDRPVFPSSACT
jgi:hypothetical protein